jgi:hypothetical protein
MIVSAQELSKIRKLNGTLLGSAKKVERSRSPVQRTFYCHQMWDDDFPLAPANETSYQCNGSCASSLPTIHFENNSIDEFRVEMWIAQYDHRFVSLRLTQMMQDCVTLGLRREMNSISHDVSDEPWFLIRRHSSNDWMIITANIRRNAFCGAETLK